MKIKTLGPSAREVSFGNGMRVLISYDVPVAAVLPDGERIRSEQFYSRTTAKHIAAFFKDDGTARTTFKTVSESTLRAIVDAL